jgi:hypothetical protein
MQLELAMLIDIPHNWIILLMQEMYFEIGL